MKYAIITGGWSKEKSENIDGAEDVYNSLILKNEVRKFIFDDSYDREQNFKIISQIKIFNPDLVFLCTTEELPIQGVLEFLDIKYTGSNILTTSLSLDKEKCKLLFDFNYIKTPPGLTVSRDILIKNSINFSSLIFPVVVKPNSSGSSCGVSFVKNHQELLTGLEKAFAFDSKVLIEKFISGREITVPMLDEKLLAVVEVVKNNEILDYVSKADYKRFIQYKKAELTTEVMSKIEIIMSKLKHIFCIKNIFRADFILTKDDKLILLEINTLPFLGDEVMGVSARAINWTYEEFLEQVAMSALI
ncbi:MAG: ATP-grasp domain-containing protein [bacterium]|nr:ATP-grasp domain-containing protein [bacterium]